jgi:cbb3-type cytochrome oxidase maturation protein
MDILYLLIPISLMFVFIIAGVFWWSLKSGQFEDLDGPGYRVLMDDDKAGGLGSAAAEDAEASPVGARPGEKNQNRSGVDSDQSAASDK